MRPYGYQGLGMQLKNAFGIFVETSEYWNFNITYYWITLLGVPT